MKTQLIAEWTHREMETIIHSVARYTKFVRSTKVVLAILVAFLTSAILFYPLTKNEDAGIRVAFTSIEKGVASPTKMINPQFHGLDKDDQPYNISAKTATQLDDDSLALDKVSGDITMKSGVWLSMSANSGLFHTKDKLLDLKGAIEMFDDEGYELRTEVLHVNVGDKSAVTKEHVEGQGPLGTLKGEGAVANGKAATITFGGPVFVTVYPVTPQQKATQEKP
jgi:lipopolysaccharide export system protein LptC